MGTEHPICRTCGVQYAQQRADCPICLDVRQYVGWGGQQWTTLDGMRADGFRGHVADEGPGLTGVGTEPAFAIGQRALLVRTDEGNVLWDCLTYLDDALVAQLEDLGGVQAIAISHPHYYGTMADWSSALDAPVYVHASDREWVMRPGDHVRFWEGSACPLPGGLTLLNLGVHFAGGTVLHRQAGPHGPGGSSVPGILLSADIVQVGMDRTSVSFMYSYPNLIPERPSIVRRAVSLLEPYEFDAIYGAWWGRNVEQDGAAVVRRSAARYLKRIEDR